MDPYYGDYPGLLPQYQPGMEIHNPASMYYGVYNRAALPMMAFEPIVPHENDILMGRGGKNNQHVGNEKFRQLARKAAQAYNTSNKKGKSNIARGLVSKVRQTEPAGRFLKRNPVTSGWEDVGDDYAREKASQVLRDAVALIPEATSEARSDDDKSDHGTDADPEELPELYAESHDRKPAANKQTKRKVEQMSSPAYYPHPSVRHNATASQPSWHYYPSAAASSPVQTVKPILTPPPMKRFFSGSIFENSAFFIDNNPTRSPNPPPLSPCFHRQESLCFSLGATSLPGENFLLTNNNSDHARIPRELTTNPPPSDSNGSDEFVSDFY